MRNKRRILVTVLLVVVLGGLAWEVLLPREPVYQGRPLRAWLHDLDTSIKERLPIEQVRVLMAEKQKKREEAEKAKDPNAHVRIGAAKALKDIDPEVAAEGGVK